MSQKTTTKETNQQSLPFEANDKAELRRMIRAIDWRRSGLTEYRWAQCVEVLCWFVSIDYDGIFPRLETIAEACKLGNRRTAGRVIGSLDSIGVVTSRRRGRTSNEYVIDFRKLASLGAAGTPSLSTQDDEFGTSNDGICPLCGSNLSTRTANLSTRTDRNKELTLSLTSSTSSTLGDNAIVTSNGGVIAGEGEEESLSDSKWIQAVVAKAHSNPEMARLLPNKFGQALRECLTRGWNREQLTSRVLAGLNLARHDGWRADRRAGALYAGLVNAEPGTPDDKGWPYR